MGKYSYNNSTNTIWTSFDFGEVEANNLEEAREKAIKQLKQDIEKVNNVLSDHDKTRTHFYKIEMDCTQVEVKLI